MGSRRHQALTRALSWSRCVVVALVLAACGASEAARSPFCQHVASGGAVPLTDVSAVDSWARMADLAPPEIADDVRVFERAAVWLADDDDLTLDEVIRRVFATPQRSADARLDAYVEQACGFRIRSLNER